MRIMQLEASQLVIDKDNINMHYCFSREYVVCSVSLFSMKLWDAYPYLKKGETR